MTDKADRPWESKAINSGASISKAASTENRGTSTSGRLNASTKPRVAPGGDTNASSNAKGWRSMAQSTATVPPDGSSTRWPNFSFRKRSDNEESTIG